jgi:hypothetical protein
MSIGPGSASIRRRIFSMPGAVLMLEAADLAEAGDVAAGLPLAGAALVTTELISLHLQAA